MAFIRKVKIKVGATAAKIAHSSFGKIINIEHICSARNLSDPKTIKNLAEKKLQDRQLPLLFMLLEKSNIRLVKAPLKQAIKKS